VLTVSQHAHQELVMSHDQDASSKAVLGYCNPMRAIGERQISSAVSTVLRVKRFPLVGQ